jgi:C-terminal processing protease CtpA/Prc
VFFDMLREHGALRGRVQPTPTPFSGSVYVLIDSGTASAAEPLAALLQSEHRATLIGERTAGAMLSSESIDLGNGWSLRLPTADYFTAEGVRLEGRGVTPDRKVTSDRSLEAAIALAR